MKLKDIKKLALLVDEIHSPGEVRCRACGQKHLPMEPVVQNSRWINPEYYCPDLECYSLVLKESAEDSYINEIFYHSKNRIEKEEIFNGLTALKD